MFCLGSPVFVPPSGPIRFFRGQTWAFFVSSSAAILAPIFLFVGSAIWTAIIKNVKDVNSWTVQPAQHPLGIEVSTGGGLTLAWVAFGLMAAGAIIPIIESALSFRLILTAPEP